MRVFEGGGGHHANFIKAVRSRNPKDLNADILEGHLSSALCHTGNISYRLGSQAGANEIMERIKADKDAVETFERMEEHLLADGVDLDKTRAVMGMMLKMDSKAERFVENDKANALLRREYRAPFVLPERV